MVHTGESWIAREHNEKLCIRNGKLAINMVSYGKYSKEIG